MDRNTKIGFAACGALWLWGMWKQFRIFERVEILTQMVNNLVEIQDNEFQIEVEERFEEIVERYDDDP